MKKMSFIFLVLVLNSGCENLPKLTPDNSSDLSSYEIGKIHNEILTYYDSKIRPDMTNEDIVFLIENYLVCEKKYDPLLVSEETSKIMSSAEYCEMFLSKSEFESSSIMAYLDAIEKKLNPSDKLMNAIRKAFTLGEEYDADFVKDFLVNNVENKSWTGIDKDVAKVFMDVFTHSYEYWTKSFETKKLKRSSLVILYDAGGAIHGMIFGPFGSIIESALLSVAANERLPED